MVGKGVLVCCMTSLCKWSIDEFHMLWLPWATHRKVWHKMAVLGCHPACLFDQAFTTAGHLQTDSGWTFRIACVTWSCMIARWHHWRHKRSHKPCFPLSVWPSSRSNFNLGPSTSALDSTGKKSIRSELMVLECSFPLCYALPIQL